MIDYIEKTSFSSGLAFRKKMKSSMRDKKILQFWSGWKILIKLMRNSLTLSAVTDRFS